MENSLPTVAMSFALSCAIPNTRPRSAAPSLRTARVPMAHAVVSYTTASPRNRSWAHSLRVPTQSSPLTGVQRGTAIVTEMDAWGRPPPIEGSPSSRLSRATRTTRPRRRSRGTHDVRAPRLSSNGRYLRMISARVSCLIAYKGSTPDVGNCSKPGSWRPFNEDWGEDLGGFRRWRSG